MKRTLMVECDLEKENGTVKIGMVSDKEEDPNPLLDMGILCEALCTLIRICHKAKIKNEADALRDCINHLRQGFVDETYKVDLLKSIKKVDGPTEALLQELSRDLGSLSPDAQIIYKERIEFLLMS
jgi:hypothetical protein